MIAASIKHAISDITDSEVCVLQPKSSAYFKTYDGIEVIGNRFLKEIYLEIEILKKESNITVSKFSIVGYSLGGLISRYIIGELNEVGFFDQVEPFFFTTFATPHLGVKFFTNPLAPVLNFLGSNLIGKSGNDLFLKSEIVPKLSDPDEVYFKALKLFKQRYLLCNVRHDRTVAFYTSFITNHSPFENWDRVKLQFLNGIPEIKVADRLVRPKIVDLKKTQFRTSDEPPPQPTLQNRIRYIGVLILIGIILPFWFPVVLTANCLGTILSFLRLNVYDNSIDNPAEWSHVKKVLQGHKYTDHAEGHSHTEVNGDGAVDNAKEAQSLVDDDSNSLALKKSRTNDDSSAISKELAGMTEGAIEGMLEATHHNYDLQHDTDEVVNSSVNVSTSSLPKGKPGVIAGGFKGAISVDFVKYASSVQKFLAATDNQQNSESQFPVFNEEPLPFDKTRNDIHQSLNSLQWYKIATYVDTFNAHDGIVSRRGLKSTPRGIATIYFWAMLLREQLIEIESKPTDAL